MRHTLVVEIPDGIETVNAEWAEVFLAPAVADLPGYIERALTGAVESTALHVAGNDFRATVVEYHHEQMTEPDPEADVPAPRAYVDTRGLPPAQGVCPTCSGSLAAHVHGCPADRNANPKEPSNDDR